ncbi:fatty acyl-AMP ligase [Micromonospora sp. R77]|uniref:fatty acyl-AMP ligase n=1 Tax=Micromonospora sp. R77 TaxID=2925836 RepID=UPI001F623877|nr:fatty acyl-AMP ligase [Micromonospora sp. R77]MCI4065668.1 fatty acyl-AMP ligase [Micromonospora sp. R77]
MTGAPTDAAAMLRDAARTRPDTRALIVLDRAGDEVESVTYAELETRVRAAAAGLAARTVPGSRALLVHPTGVDFVVGFFACAYAGLIGVPVPYPHAATGGVERLAGIAKDADPALILTDADFAAQRYDLPGEVTVLDPAATAPAHWQPVPVDPDTPLFLQYTSGSTSAPKGAVITHGNVVANFTEVADVLDADRVDFTVVSWLPLYHDMGLGQVLSAIRSAGTAVLIPPAAFLMRPAVWPEAVSRYRGYVSSAPNFAYDLCAARTPAATIAGLDLSGWRWLLNGAEPVRHDTFTRFAAAFAPAGFSPDGFMPSYGLAEGTLYVSGRRAPGPLRHVDLDAEALERGTLTPAGAGPARRIVSCGAPARNLAVVIADPQTGAVLGADAIGEICVAGPSVAHGYWQQPEATAARFGHRVAGSTHDHLRTGDLGFFRDGELYVLGRADDLIIVDGRNIFPQDVERTVDACHPDLAPGRSAAFGLDRSGETVLGIAVETARGAASGGELDQQTRAELVAAVRRRVVEEHQVPVGAVILLRPGGLPRTTSGKVQRRPTRARYLDGTLKTW